MSWSFYESMLGNTGVIAEAIAEGVREAVPDAQVACLRVAESDAERIQAADLLVVGGPTHMRGLTSGLTRKMGLAAEKK
jgi:Flavodoxin